MTNQPQPIGNIDLDFTMLDKLYAKTQREVFLGKNASFLGSVMCSLNFSWTSDIKTACTNGLSLWWNPYWFLQLPFETKKTVLLHELWHVAKLHMIRRGDRHPKIWNFACDVHINNDLKKHGYTFAGTDPWIDPVRMPDGSYFEFKDMTEEDIYDILWKAYDEEWARMLKAWGHEDANDGEDILEPEKEDGTSVTDLDVITKVVQASQAAKMAGEDVGGVETLLKRFLQPKIPWETKLYRWFDGMSEWDYRWNRPNRRYRDMYLPSLQQDQGLEHLIYFLDVSGSISDGEIVRFNSEVKYIKEVFNPEKLTLVQFDTRITSVKEFTQEEPFEELIVVGRGGTSLLPVRDYIEKHKPTAAVVFSDLFCEPMVKIDTPILWVVVNNPSAKVNCGEMIHIRE